MARHVDTGAHRAAALGLFSLALGVLGPFAIRSSLRSWRRISSSQGQATGRFPVLVGLVSGLISTALMVAGLAWFIGTNLP